MPLPEGGCGFRLDWVPGLCSVFLLVPACPQVSTQLYSAREKLQLSSLVGTMLAYSLTYRQERTPDGQYVYRLEP